MASIVADAKVFSLTPAQREELDRRVADDDRFPDEVLPWSEVKTSVRARLELCAPNHSLDQSAPPRRLRTVRSRPASLLLQLCKVRASHAMVWTLCAVWSAAIAQTLPSSTSKCESVVVVRCPRPANGSRAATESLTGLEATKEDLAAERTSIDDGLGRVVIVGKAPKSKGQMLQELIQGAAPLADGMTFRTVQNGDGTQCTCASAPCVLNCCVCTPSKTRGLP